MFPVHWFSDIDPEARRFDKAGYLRDEHEAMDKAHQSGHFNIEAYMAAMDEANLRSGQGRKLVSYSLFVGEALDKALQIGDELFFLRDLGGRFGYWVERNGELTFSAGTAHRPDRGGPFAVWQEYDTYLNPNADKLKEQYKHQPSVRIAESFDVHKPYVSVRIKEKNFRLLDEQDAHVHPFYAFLARANQPCLTFEFEPMAVHAAGRLDQVEKELIIDAAYQLTEPRTRLL